MVRARRRRSDKVLGTEYRVLRPEERRAPPVLGLRRTISIVFDNLAQLTTLERLHQLIAPLSPCHKYYVLFLRVAVRV